MHRETALQLLMEGRILLEAVEWTTEWISAIALEEVRT